MTIWFLPVACLLLLGAEWMVSRVQGKRVYKLGDTCMNLGCGIMERAVVFASLPFLYWIYMQVWEGGLRLSLHPKSWTSWLMLFVLQDFCYYWLHRSHHRVGFFWAAHGVHHQSREMNFSVGMRTAAAQVLTSWPFYLVIPWLGFPLWMFLIVLTAQNIFQLFAHTRLIPRMGILDSLFNTASNHRMHHEGRDPRIGFNFGGFLMIWDRLFGTYRPEIQEVAFGIAGHIPARNLVFAIVMPWRDWWRKP